MGEGKGWVNNWTLIVEVGFCFHLKIVRVQEVVRREWFLGPRDSGIQLRPVKGCGKYPVKEFVVPIQSVVFLAYHQSITPQHWTWIHPHRLIIHLFASLLGILFFILSCDLFLISACFPGTATKDMHSYPISTHRMGLSEQKAHSSTIPTHIIITIP